ncbi:MAG: cell wall-active antibiotics response protein [Acidimicrobiia bacterium]|nr:cell wall-active antibiotics response protein [Acidimicrobiia bacterium]
MTAPSPPAPPRPVGERPADPGGITSSWGATTVGLVLVLLGAAWLLDLGDVIELRAALVLPALLTLVGVALIIGSLRRPHPGLIAFGTILTLLVAIAAVAPSEAVRGGLGERHHTVSRASDLDDQYEVGIGDLVLDLSELDLAEARDVRVSVGAGNLNVVLPADLPVDIEAKSGAGEIILFDDKVEGVGLDQEHRDDDYTGDGPGLALTLEIGAGSIEVNR